MPTSKANVVIIETNPVHCQDSNELLSLLKTSVALLQCSKSTGLTLLIGAV